MPKEVKRLSSFLLANHHLPPPRRRLWNFSAPVMTIDDISYPQNRNAKLSHPVRPSSGAGTYYRMRF